MKRKDDGLLRLIAVFKLFKAISLIAVGLGALDLTRNKHAADALTHLAARLGLTPGSRYLDHALAKVANLPPRDFRELGIGSFIYAALFLTEGLGLWLRKPWGEWFTVIITGSLLPLEIYEIQRHPTLGKIVLFVLNLAVVVYLVARIRRERYELD